MRATANFKKGEEVNLRDKSDLRKANHRAVIKSVYQPEMAGEQIRYWVENKSMTPPGTISEIMDESQLLKA